jgi:hypothetical protein
MNVNWERAEDRQLLRHCENHTLTKLSLGHNSLGEGGGQAIAAALRENHTLTELDLDCNSIGKGSTGNCCGTAREYHAHKAQL